MHLPEDKWKHGKNISIPTFIYMFIYNLYIYIYEYYIPHNNHDSTSWKSGEKTGLAILISHESQR